MPGPTGEIQAVRAKLPHLPNGALVMLDLEAQSLADCINQVSDALAEELESSEEHQTEIRQLLLRHTESGPDLVANHVAVVHGELKTSGPSVELLVRLTQDVDLVDAQGVPARFIWFLLSAQTTHPHIAAAAEFVELMASEQFFSSTCAAKTAEELEKTYSTALNNEIRFAARIPAELRRTGRIFGGFVNDVRRRAPSFGSDFKDGINPKGLASVVFLFFACLAPAIAFGGLLSSLTEGQLGVMEMIVATAICGTSYALLSGQPLTILGSTGPVIIFVGILFSACKSYNIDFMQTLCCVGIWTMLILLLLAAIDACSWIRYFTRFTDDTFAALISIIFIFEALKDVAKGFVVPDVARDVALLSLVLSLGTFYIAMQLYRFRASIYLHTQVREFLSDFGPTIAIGAMTLVAFMLPDVGVEMLRVTAKFGTTSGRPWLVNPFQAPAWVWAASIGPALLVSVLLFLDQNITVRLVNSPDHKLKKGSGYHLDLAIVALLVGVCSILGLPWMVAATVRSLNHVRSLVVTEQTDDREGRAVERIVGVQENRFTALAVHLLIALSLNFLGLLNKIPMSTLYGLFLYMGVGSMTGNQLFKRLRLWFILPSRYPPTYYLRAVPSLSVHMFTAIQFLCLLVLWVVKVSKLGILFPLFIAFLVPVRMTMGHFFKPEHLALLDADEEPTDEKRRAKF